MDSIPLQIGWVAGPIVFGPDGRPRPTLLFCAWLACRVPRRLANLEPQARHVVGLSGHHAAPGGGAPALVLTDNKKTVTVEHVAGVPVRHPMMVAAGRHYGMTVHTCVPLSGVQGRVGGHGADRERDLVPTKANLRTGYTSFAELSEACEEFCEKVNHRMHRETHRIPAEALAVEQGRMHPVPAAPYTAALGETRTVATDQTIRFGSVRYPHATRIDRP